MDTASGRNNLALATCYAAMMGIAISSNLMPVFLTTLSEDMGGAGGLTKEQLGRIGSTAFAGIVAGILIAGPLADRLGAKPFAVLGNATMAAGLALLGTARDYATLIAAVFAIGLGGGTLDMVLSPIVSALRPERRAAAMNWLHSFYCTGAVLTVLAGSLALSEGVPWRRLSLALAAAPILVGLAFLGQRLPPLVEEGAGRTRLRVLCRAPWFLAALGAILLAGAAELGMAQWLPAYAEMGLGLTAWTGGMGLLAFSVAMAAGRVLAGALAGRVDAFAIMIACCLACAALLLAGCFAPWPGAALAACAATGLAVSPLWPCVLAVTADRFPQGGASMFAMLAAFGNIGGIVMPWLIGVAADRSTIGLGLAAAAVCPAAMLALVMWMERGARR